MFFTKTDDKRFFISIMYEMGTLPSVEIFKDNKIINSFSVSINEFEYPIHYKMNEITQKKITSIKNYIKSLSVIWDENQSPIENEVDFSLMVLSKSLLDHLKKNGNINK